MQKVMIVKRSLTGTLILFSFLVTQIAQASPIVRMETSEGSFSIELYDWAAPLTVKNFLRYTNTGRYDNTFIHRSMTQATDGFGIIQGGGFSYDGTEWGLDLGITQIVNFGAVDAEISLSNTVGTLAMANSGSPYSSGSQWYFNVTDNSVAFDGKYSVFGEIVGNDLAVIESINNISTSNKGGAFQSIPLINYSDEAVDPTIANLIWVNRVFEDTDNNQIPDNEQNYVVSIWNSSDKYILFTTQENNTLTFSEIVNVLDIATLPTELLPPIDQEIDSSLWAQKILQVGGVESVDGGATPGATTVTIIYPEGTNPKSYYMYGRETPADATDHWYEFTYDGTTGAEINGNVVTLYLVDGQRGDSGLDVADGAVVVNDGGAVQFLKTAVHTNSANNSMTFITPGGADLVVSEITQEVLAPLLPELSLLELEQDRIIELSQGAQAVTIVDVASDNTATTITIAYPAGTNPDSFYMYGSTPDNLSNHWYKFDYDPATKTGAVIRGDTITVYLANGARGDASLGVSYIINVALGGVVRYLADINRDGIADMDQNVVSGGYLSYISPRDITMEVSEAVGAIRSTAFDRLVTQGGEITEVFFSGFQAITNITADTVDISIVLPKGDIPSSYYFYDSAADYWYDLGYDSDTGANTGLVEIDGNVVTLHLADGGRGDSNPEVGKIGVDLGAVVKNLDANGDDIADKDQSNVFSIWIKMMGSKFRRITYISPTGSSILVEGKTTEQVTGDSTNLVDQLADFHIGTQAIRITGATPDTNGVIDVSVILPSDANGSVAYYMYGPTLDNTTDHWFKSDAELGTSIINERERILATLYLVDNGNGDSDPTDSVINIKLGGDARQYLDFYDSNNDNIADWETPDFVKKFPNILSELIVAYSPAGTLLEAGEQSDLDLFAKSLDEPSVLSFPEGSVKNFINFNHGIQKFKVSQIVSGDNTATITMILPEGARPHYYYIYGPTPDNAANHWFKFTFDAGTNTGAIINGNVVTLYVVDGGRGDFDLETNNEISVLGGVVITVPIEEGRVDSSSGCAISGYPANIWRGGSWIIVLLFLLFLKIANYQSSRRVRRGKLDIIKISSQ